MNQLALLQLILSLLQKVQVLENELAALNVPAVGATTTMMVFPTWTPPTQNEPIIGYSDLGAAEPAQPSCSLTGTVTSVNPSANVFAGANVELDWTFQNMNPTAGTLLAYSKYGLSYPYAIDGTSTTYSYHPIFKATFDSVSCYAYLPDYWTNNTQFPNTGDVSTSTEPSEYQQFNSIIN